MREEHKGKDKEYLPETRDSVKKLLDEAIASGGLNKVSAERR